MLSFKANGAYDDIQRLWVKEEENWAEMKAMWVKENGFYNLIFPEAQYFELGNAQNVNLNRWLNSKGAKPNREIIIRIPKGRVVGGTVNGGHAIWTGDVSRFKSVLLIVDGEIQGHGGNWRHINGGHGINVNDGISIELNGAIRGGGGGGGRGGRGANGDYFNAWTEYGNPGTSDVNTCSNQMNWWRNTNEYSRWCNGAYGNANGAKYLRYATGHSDNRFKYRWHQDGGRTQRNYDGQRNLKTIDMCYHQNHIWTQGGLGGVPSNGQGYRQARGVVNPAKKGGINSGNGGNSGRGGEWGDNGTNGLKGKSSIYAKYLGIVGGSTGSRSRSTITRWGSAVKESDTSVEGGGTAGLAIFGTPASITNFGIIEGGVDNE